MDTPSMDDLTMMRRQQRTRLLEVLGRHVRAQDGRLSDLDFARAVQARMEKEREGEIVDVNE